jgi:hypothetical protein
MIKRNFVIVLQSCLYNKDSFKKPDDEHWKNLPNAIDTIEMRIFNTVDLKNEGN